MPKPGMTRSEEIVYHGFGSTLGAIFGGVGDIIAAFLGAIIAGAVMIIIPTVGFLSVLNGIGIVQDTSILSFVQLCTNVLTTAVDSFVGGIMSIFSWIFGGGKAAGSAVTTTVTNITSSVKP